MKRTKGRSVVPTTVPLSRVPFKGRAIKRHCIRVRGGACHCELEDIAMSCCHAWTSSHGRFHSQQSHQGLTVRHCHACMAIWTFYGKVACLLEFHPRGRHGGCLACKGAQRLGRRQRWRWGQRGQQHGIRLLRPQALGGDAYGRYVVGGQRGEPRHHACRVGIGVGNEASAWASISRAQLQLVGSTGDGHGGLDVHAAAGVAERVGGGDCRIAASRGGEGDGSASCQRFRKGRGA